MALNEGPEGKTSGLLDLDSPPIKVYSRAAGAQNEQATSKEGKPIKGGSRAKLRYTAGRKTTCLNKKTTEGYY